MGPSSGPSPTCGKPPSPWRRSGRRRWRSGRHSCRRGGWRDGCDGVGRRGVVCAPGRERLGGRGGRSIGQLDDVGCREGDLEVRGKALEERKEREGGEEGGRDGSRDGEVGSEGGRLGYGHQRLGSVRRFLSHLKVKEVAKEYEWEC